MIDKRFVAGPPEMIRIHDNERLKHPAEFEGNLRGYNPDAPRFTPAPARKRPDFVPPSVRPDEAWCSGCRQYHPANCFHKDRSRPNGLKAWCIEYRAVQRKLGPDKKDVAWNWYRAAK